MIKIKHNIKRKGCTISGQILDCQFSGKEERGHAFIKKGKYFIMSAALPQIWKNELWIWGNVKSRDLIEMSYTYSTEQAAQDMLDFINTFTDKEEAIKEQVEEKSKTIRYALVRVGGKIDWNDKYEKTCLVRHYNGINGGWRCHLSPEEENVFNNSDGLCLHCPHGKTLEQISDEIKKLQDGQDDKSI